MKRCRVVTLPSAERQILRQVLFIAEDSVDNALAWEQRIRAAVQSLGEIPRAALDEDATDRLGEPIHKFVFEKTYLIHYRFVDSGRTVEILNFRHGARLPKRGEP
jgi:plasmid stabilization system protein ParE